MIWREVHSNVTFRTRREGESVWTLSAVQRMAAQPRRKVYTEFETERLD
jgi:hypothetical protein